MAAHRTSAIVLRWVDVFETSRVVTLFSRELGKLSALAKGARRLKSPFGSSLDVLSVCDVVLLHKGGEVLDLLTEAELSERFPELHRSLPAWYAALYVAELLYELTDELDPHPRLFDAAVVTLRHLGKSEQRAGRLLRFELAILRETGLLPSLGSCVHCGAEVGRGERVSFGLATGGVLCAGCRPGQPHVATISGETLEALRVLASPGPGWRSLDYGPRSLGPLRATLGAVISHLLRRRPRMLDFV